MRKGVSPVVAAVLLIAIAVIAAVAVWYWVSPLTAKPPTADTTQKSISIERCYPPIGGSTYLDIRNVGGIAIPIGTNFTVYNLATGGVVANAYVYVNATAFPSGVSSGTVAKIPVRDSTSPTGSGMTLTGSTAYFLMASGIPTATFTC